MGQNTNGQKPNDIKKAVVLLVKRQEELVTLAGKEMLDVQ